MVETKFPVLPLILTNNLIKKLTPLFDRKETEGEGHQTVVVQVSSVLKSWCQSLKLLLQPSQRHAGPPGGGLRASLGHDAKNPWWWLESKPGVGLEPAGTPGGPRGGFPPEFISKFIVENNQTCAVTFIYFHDCDVQIHS